MNLSGRSQTLKWKDWQVEFSERIIEVKQDAEKAIPQPPAVREIRVSDTVRVGTGEEARSTSQERFLDLADRHPAAAILESWLDFETELRISAARHGIPSSEKLPTSQLAEELRKRELWDAHTLRIFSELRALRNTVVHTRTGAITPAQAVEYDLLIRRLIAKLRASSTI